MADAFDRALAFTLGVEGEISNDPADRGGLTNRGITQRLYDAWRTTTGKPRQDVRLITLEEITQIARDEFWEPCACGELPDDLAIAVFDMAFNSSPWNAKLTLQRALGFTGKDVDGVIGIHTLQAVKTTPDAAFEFLVARGAYIRDLCWRDPSQLKFLGGWINRLLLQARSLGSPT